MLSTKKKHLDVDTVFGALFLLLFAVGVHAFQYRSVLGEADLYRVLNGMLDGAVTGSGLDSPPSLWQRLWFRLYFSTLCLCTC
jgi:hypothetical protein